MVEKILYELSQVRWWLVIPTSIGGAIILMLLSI